MSVRVGLVSLGCTKNQVDAERMLYKIREAGYQLVSDAALADIAIINTCGFIESAKQEAIETIFEFAALKNEGRIKNSYYGPAMERYREEVAELIPEADAVVGIGSNEDIVSILGKIMTGEAVQSYGKRKGLRLRGDVFRLLFRSRPILKSRRAATTAAPTALYPPYGAGSGAYPWRSLLKKRRKWCGTAFGSLLSSRRIPRGTVSTFTENTSCPSF